MASDDAGGAAGPQAPPPQNEDEAPWSQMERERTLRRSPISRETLCMMIAELEATIAARGVAASQLEQAIDLVWVNDLVRSCTETADWPTLTRFQQEQRITRAFLDKLRAARIPPATPQGAVSP